MTKLKTLKDLVLCCVKEDRADGGCDHAQKVLKKEAIKWVKKFLETEDLYEFTLWRMFFNITEDELK